MELFLKNVVRLQNLPKDITIDQGSQFSSQFWRQLLQTFWISMNLSSSYDPQTNGQTERVNQILEQYFWCTVSYQQEDWVDFVAMETFSYHNSIHASTRVSHFLQTMGSTLVSAFPFRRFPEISVNPLVEMYARTLLCCTS